MNSNPTKENTASSNAETWSTVSVQPGGPISGAICPPGSKSLTNRALICAAAASGTTCLSGALVSEDTEVMIDSLGKVGIQVELSDAGRSITIHNGGSLGAPRKSDGLVELYIANSGTSLRFLASMLSVTGGNYRLHGVPRMHERPIGDLVSALQEVVDGTIETESPDHCPPVRIQTDGWKGDTISVAGSVSSQYLSGIMMAAGMGMSQTAESPGPITIGVKGELVSRPYVEMTAAVMRSFGVDVSLTDSNESDDLVFKVPSNGYQGSTYAIEPDASAASYFWAAAAISGGSVEVIGLTPNAMQGDVGFCEVLQRMGCRLSVGPNSMTITGKATKGIDVNMNAISDTVQTLAIVALFADGPTRIRGVAHNRFKETDRIGDLAKELRKLGAEVQEHEDGLTISGQEENLKGATLETYHDHRMAMSLALAGLRIPDVHILNPSCTSKTYPNYFSDLERLLGRAHCWKSGS